MGLSAAASAAPATSAARSNEPATDIYVAPFTRVAGDDTGIDWDDPLTQEVVQGSAELEGKVIRIPAGTKEAQDAALERGVSEATAQWAEALDVDAPAPGEFTTYKKHTKFGDCGTSFVQLDPLITNKIEGYMKAGFTLDGPKGGPGGAYDTNVLVFSTSHLDLWTKNFPWDGDLAGRTSWSKDTRITFPKKQNYGATLNRATVHMLDGGWCYSHGPSVDEVYMQ